MALSQNYKKLKYIINSSDKLRQYRILSIVVSFFYILFGIIFLYKRVADPMGIQRFLILALLLTGYTISFFSSWYRHYINRIMFLYLIVIHLQLLILGYLDHFSSFYVISIISIVFVSNLLFDDLYVLTYYNLIMSLLTTILIFIAYNNESKFQLILVFLTASLLSSLINYSKITMEKDMKDSRLKYEIIFQESPIGLITIEPNGRIIDVNKELIDIFTVHAREYLLGKNVFDFLYFLDEKDMEVIKGTVYSGQTKSGTFEYKNKLVISYRIRPIFDNNKSIKEYIIALRDITMEQKNQNRVNYLTYHDSLTGLYNRNYLNKEISNIDIDQNLPLSIIVGDMNGLKLTNDTFGHKEGDRILIAAADIIKDVCIDSYYSVRWGGDEFLIYLPNTDYKETQVIADKIRERFAQVKIGPIHPTIALGFETKTSINQDINEVFRNAEEHMYTNKLQESRNAHSNIISSLKKTLSETTNETSLHCERVREQVIKLGQSIGLSDYQLTEIGLLAELHDLGKVAIPDMILQKEEELVEEEWEQIKKHCEIGYKVASSSPELSKISEGILCHHEWWDGSGYPQGLKGKEIPLSARIVSIVDAFDVMTKGRMYQKSLTFDEALQELTKGKGKQFDPELVDAFINMLLKNKLNKYIAASDQ